MPHFTRTLLAGALFGLLAAGAGLVQAGEVRMRSGMVLTGQPRKLLSLTVKGTLTSRDSSIQTYTVVMVETGSARYFIPSKQVADGGLNLDATGLARQEAFRLDQKKTNPKSLTFASVGQFAEVEPFDQYGRRRIWLNTANGKIPVVQGITQITPDYVTLTGLTHNWDYGVSTRSIPGDALELILRHRVDPRDPKQRLSLARFFIQAELFPQAFQELDAIARDFPDLKDQATSAHQGLVQEFGRVVLREIRSRVEAGQHRLAEEYARQITPDRIGGAVQKEAQEFLKACEHRRDTMARTAELLDALSANLDGDPLARHLPPLRSVVLDELHPATLDRLDPFLKAETDDTLSPAEKLALAYSGWVLGAANAVTSLDQAVRLWDARFLVQEALRAPTPNERQLVYQQLRRLEGVGPEVIRKLIPQLPPVVETPGIEPGRAQRIEVAADDQTPPTAYSVLLPIEYSPHHSYPLLIALRAEGKSIDQTLSLWGGTEEQPGPTQRRGYILVVPEYAPNDRGEYAYDAATHHHVLAALNDARRRFHVDSDRIYLTGHGMGADAAFDLGFSHPDEFAGVIPICGVCDHYCKFYRENAYGVAWYVIGGELDRDKAGRNLPFFDQLFKQGFKYDVTYCEFAQRGYESYAEEFPRVFEWMSLHRRQPLPKTIDVESLRKTDQRFFWVAATNLPQNVILPLPPGHKIRVSPMKIKARVTPENLLYVASPSNRHTLWIHPELVDLERRVKMTINGRTTNQFIDPDFTATIDDFRERGDRQRLCIAKLEV
jgi:predicted esterase